MATQYYNPHQKQERPIDHPTHGIEFNQSAAIFYIASNKFLAKKLEMAAKNYKVKVATLKSVLIGIALTSQGAFTTAGQAKIAEKGNVSVSTVKKSVAALRKVGAINVKHRYSKDKATRRRITSITTFSAYVKFVDFLRYAKLKTINSLLIASNIAKKCVETGFYTIPDGVSVDFNTGEIINY